MTQTHPQPADAIEWARRYIPEVPTHLAPVLAVIAAHADPDGRNAHPPKPTIAERSGRSVPQVHRDLKELLGCGTLVAGNPDAPSRRMLPADKRPPVYDIPALSGCAWEPPGSRSGVECEAAWRKAQLNRAIIGQERDITSMSRPSAAEAFRDAEHLIEAIDPAGFLFGPSDHRLMRRELIIALRNGHTVEYLTDLLEQPLPDTGHITTALLDIVRAHQHEPQRPNRPADDDTPAEHGHGNRTFKAAFEIAHQIASTQQTPRRQYVGFEFQELLHLLVVAALDGATRAELERLVSDEPAPGVPLTQHVLEGLWPLVRGERRPFVAPLPAEPEPQPEVFATRTPDRELDSVIAEQTDPIPPDEATTWADRIIRRINLHHTLLHQTQVTEMRWPLVKALRNGQPPAYLARVMIQPTANVEDPGAELLHRITLHYWPGRST